MKQGFEPGGIIPPVVTPFDEAGEVNEAALQQVVEYVITNGVHGIFPMGTTGEFYAVDDDAYRRVIEICVEQANGRVPVYAGCNHITPKGAARLIREAAKAGADAVSVLTPMFVSQTQEELYAYYKTLAEDSDLPIVMYNNRPKTNVTIAPETAARLAELENIVGVKDSTGDMTNTEEYLRLTRTNPTFRVLMGRDTLIYAALCYGAAGAIASCANVAPRITADIYERYMAGDHAGALEAQYRLAPLRIACGMGTFPEAIKEGLELLGFPVGACMPPIGRLTGEQREKLKQVINGMGLETPLAKEHGTQRRERK